MAEDILRPKTYRRESDRAPSEPHPCACTAPIVWPGVPVCGSCGGELATPVDPLAEAEPVRQLRPPTVEMIAAVGDRDLTLGRFRVWPEGRKSEAVDVEAHGIFGALDMGPDLFPDGDPWCAEAVSDG